jgi:hypothetical protein
MRTLSIVVLLFVVVLMPLAAETHAIDDLIPALPDGLVALGTVILGAGAAVAQWLKKRKPFDRWLSRVGPNLISEERMDAAVERILSGNGPPSPFVDWVGDVISKLVALGSHWPHISHNQRIGILADAFSRLGAGAVEKLLPGIPPDIARRDYAKRTVAKAILRGNAQLEAVVAKEG